MYEGDVWRDEVEVIRQGDQAVLVEYDSLEIWIPYSQLQDDSEIGDKSEPGDIGELVIPRWLAKKEEL